MFAIAVETIFHATHALRLPGGDIEPAHAHDFHVTVKIGCDTLDALETVLDFHPVEEALAKIVGPWRGGDLNTFEPFVTRLNPSAERIAEHIGREMAAALPALAGADATSRRVRLLEVQLTEAPNCLALWVP